MARRTYRQYKALVTTARCRYHCVLILLRAQCCEPVGYRVLWPAEAPKSGMDLNTDTACNLFVLRVAFLQAFCAAKHHAKRRLNPCTIEGHHDTYHDSVETRRSRLVNPLAFRSVGIVTSSSWVFTLPSHLPFHVPGADHVVATRGYRSISSVRRGWPKIHQRHGSLGGGVQARQLPNQELAKSFQVG